MRWRMESRTLSRNPAPARQKNHFRIYSWNCCSAGRAPKSEETPALELFDQRPQPPPDPQFANHHVLKNRGGPMQGVRNRPFMRPEEKDYLRLASASATAAATTAPIAFRDTSSIA